MNNQFIPLISMLIAFSVFSCKTESTPKPNVVFILADDLGYGDISCLGQEKFQTPNIDRIAAQGMVFTNSYSGNAICSPSRAVLMTGQDPGHVNCRGNGPGEVQAQLDSTMITLPRMFKNAGYATGAFGKWGLGYTFQKGNANPLTHGFDEFYGCKSQIAAHTYFPTKLVDNGKLVNVENGTYVHDMIIDRALDFIKRSVSDKKPFFCYVPSTIPHAAMQAPRELHEKWRKKYPQFDTIIGKYNAGDEPCPDVINPIAAFGAMIEKLDTEVGRILATLKELGVEENTIVIFTSDNGSHQEGGHDPEFWNSNGPFRGHKNQLFEGGIHGPFLVRWPAKVKPGTTSNLISGFWDVLPTMAELTGQPIPEQTNGISLLPTLTGNEKEQQEHEYMFWELGNKSINGQAVRMGNWKALRDKRLLKKDESTLPITEWPIELYNLSTDIGEEHNVADQHPEVVAKAMKIMQEGRVDVVFK